MTCPREKGTKQSTKKKEKERKKPTEGTSPLRTNSRRPETVLGPLHEDKKKEPILPRREKESEKKPASFRMSKGDTTGKE